MGYLQEGKNFFTGDITMDPASKQVLKDNLPKLANDPILKDADVLPNEYVKEKLIPAIHTLTQLELLKFDSEIKTKGRLKDLIADIREVSVYIPRDGNALPAEQVVPDRLRSSFKSGFKDITTFLTGVADLNTEAEKEEKLIGEIIASANRSAMKFDRYVIKGDGKQYGDNAHEWLAIDSWNTDIKRPENNKKISNSVENVPKIDFVTVLNDVVAMAKAPGNTVNIDGKAQLVGQGTRIEKLAYLASWLSALEEGCDKVLPSMAAEAVTKTATGITSTVFGAVGDTVGGVASEYPILTVLLVGVLSYGAYKTGSLVSGVVNTATGSIPLRVVAKGASMFKLTQGVAPALHKFSDALSVWKKPEVVSPVSGATPGIPVENSENFERNGKTYYNPKNPEFQEFRNSYEATILSDPNLKDAALDAANPKLNTPEKVDAENVRRTKIRNTRFGQLDRLLADYKKSVANGNPKYDKDGLGQKAERILAGKEDIIKKGAPPTVLPTTTKGKVVEGLKTRGATVLKTTGTAIIHPIRTLSAGIDNLADGFDGKGWGVAEVAANKRTHESRIAGDKNEPFKVKGVGGTVHEFPMKPDIANELKKIEDKLLPERIKIEKALVALEEVEVTRAEITKLEKVIADMKTSDTYFQTSSNFQQSNMGRTTLGTDAKQPTQVAVDIEKELGILRKDLTRETKALSKLEKKFASITDAQKAFSDKSGEIHTALEKAYTEGFGNVASKHPKNKIVFEQDARGIVVEKFLIKIGGAFKGIK